MCVYIHGRHVTDGKGNLQTEERWLIGDGSSFPLNQEAEAKKYESSLISTSKKK